MLNSWHRHDYCIILPVLIVQYRVEMKKVNTDYVLENVRRSLCRDFCKLCSEHVLK